MAANQAQPPHRVVVVGAGYTGTEVAAQGQLLTTRLVRHLPALAGQSKTADRVLRRRGVDVRTGQSVAEALDDSVHLSTGGKVPTRSLIWCVGVRAVPLASGLDLETNRGRLVVDEYMAVPGAPDIYACGDCAAVPDPTRPGQVWWTWAGWRQRRTRSASHCRAQPRILSPGAITCRPCRVTACGS